MPQVTCSRCFAVFQAADARTGSAPLCPACAPARPGAPGAPSARRPAPAPRGRPRAARWVALAAALAALGVAAVVVLRRAPEAAPAAPTAIEERIEEWRTAGLLPAVPADPLAAEARAREELAADRPERTARALSGFREAIAAAPARAGGAVAGYALAFAELAGEEPEGPELRATHELVRAALERAPADPELLAAWARLLLVTPGPASAAEARAHAARALEGAPGSSAARLALGLARLEDDPAAAARTLEEGLAAAPGERRLRSAAARARWAAGDAAAALAHAEARLAQDSEHAETLALRAEIELASDKVAAGRRTLARLERAAPGSPLAPLLLARVAYQLDGDLPRARRLLETAGARGAGAFTAARILAHRAAVERAAGDAGAAQAAVDEALRRVPGSAPARFQAALLAYERGDGAELRRSAGVLADRAGPLVAATLAARSAELSGTYDEAQEAYLALAERASRHPDLLLAAAGALARLRAPGPALAVARRALERDPLEGRLRRAPTDFWEGPAALADAARRLEAIGRAEPRAAARAFQAAATCELLLGRAAAAERLGREAAAAAPQYAPLALLAQVALDRRDLRTALARARAAVEARPGDATALAVRARVLEALGRNLDAERSHRAALEAAPELATARLGLARLLARHGDAPAARQLLEELLREDRDLTEPRAALLALPAGAAGGGR